VRGKEATISGGRGARPGPAPYPRSSGCRGRPSEKAPKRRARSPPGDAYEPPAALLRLTRLLGGGPPRASSKGWCWFLTVVGVVEIAWLCSGAAPAPYGSERRGYSSKPHLPRRRDVPRGLGRRVGPPKGETGGTVATVPRSCKLCSRSPDPPRGRPVLRLRGRPRGGRVSRAPAFGFSNPPSSTRRRDPRALALRFRCTFPLRRMSAPCGAHAVLPPSRSSFPHLRNLAALPYPCRMCTASLLLAVSSRNRMIPQGRRNRHKADESSFSGPYGLLESEQKPPGGGRGLLGPIQLRRITDRDVMRGSFGRSGRRSTWGCRWSSEC
jgi:hypothetical protein